MSRDNPLFKTKNLFFKPLLDHTKKAKVEIGQNNIFHACVTLKSEGGDIKIGNFNIFEDRVVIYNKSSSTTMFIGNFNHFKEASHIQTSFIQNYNVFGMRSFVTKCKFGKGNIIGTNAKIKPTQTPWQQKTISQNGLI